jgi:transposase-like protein
MDELEIKLVINFKVPENGLTLNGIFHGLGEDNSHLMNHVIKAILRAFEDKAIEEIKSHDPGRYVRNGRQPRARKFITSFGPVRYRLAQVHDKRRGKIFCPLMKKLEVIPHKRYQREALEAVVGQAIHLSYRLASKEVARIQGHAPSKTTVHRYVQQLAQTHGQWPVYKNRPFRFLMVDGTKVRLQGPRGESLGKKNMRWALASEGVGKRFEPVGFWVDKSWKSIREDLVKRLAYEKLEVLFSDGEPGIEENLLDEGMRQQRCTWHGKRDFFVLLFHDGLKKKEQEPLRELLDSIPLFWLNKNILEDVHPPEKELVVELVEEIKKSFQRLIDALDPQRYPKTRTYMENFSKRVLVVFDYWLEGKGWIPLTTNAIESALSRIVNRVKRTGRRWSEEGLMNWLMLALRKIYQPQLWDKLWEQYLEGHKCLTLCKIRTTYAWI